MAYRIDFAEHAMQEFSKLDNTVKKQILKYIEKISQREDPRTLGEPLQANLSAYWKYRIGDYRLVTEIQNDKLVVLVLVVSHRRDVYKKADKIINREN